MSHWWILAVALVAGACYQSDTPLDPGPPATLDARLLGVWRCVGSDPSDDAITIRVAATPSSRMYAITWEESGKAPDRYEGYLSSLADAMFLNLREVPAKPGAKWSFTRVRLLRPTVAQIQMVHEDLLKGLGSAAVRNAVLQQRNNPKLYEKAPLACIKPAG